MSSSNDDDDLFQMEMGDVEPLKIEKKISLKRDSTPEAVHKARRESATTSMDKDDNHLVDDNVELLDPYYQLEFKRPGVQHGVFKKLRQGKYQQEARLDLTELHDRLWPQVADLEHEGSAAKA